MKEIIINNLRKEFKDKLILKKVDLHLYSGKIYGISGRNGTGKTVLLKLLTGLMKPDEGEIIIDNKKLGDDMEFFDSVGVIIDKPEFFEELNGIKNLKIFAEIKNKINDEDILKIFNLFELHDTKKIVRKYSLGMKQRLGLAQAFMESPDFIVLDEFTNGLDKEGIVFIREYIKNYKSDDRIIILTSHYEEDLISLCDERFTIENGEIKKYVQ